jgi:hypothetical protein
LPFLGYFFNDPTKSSLIGEKSPNLVTLDKSDTPFFGQAAAWFPDMFRNFYLVKNHKIADNSTNTAAGEKITRI